MSNRYVEIMMHRANSDGPLDYKHRVAEYIADLESRLSESQQRERVLREALVGLMSAVSFGDYWDKLANAKEALAGTDHISDTTNKKQGEQE